MSAEIAATSGEPESKGGNEFGSLFSIFVNPRGTFAAMAEKPRFILALLLVIVALSAMTAVIFQTGVVRDETIAKLEAKGTPQPQIDATEKFFDSPMGTVMAVVGNVVGVPFVMLFSAALLFFMGNFMLGGKLRYPHYLSAASYGAIIALIDHAVRTALVMSKQSMDVRLGLGNLFGEDLPYIGRVIDSMTDPLLLWASAVTALGIAVYAKKGFGFGVLASLPSFIVSLLLSGMR